MGLKIQIIAFVVGLIFFFTTWSNIRKVAFKPSYTFLWLLVSLFLFSIPVLEPIYKWAATNIIGINDARHIIYVFIIGFLLVYIFYLSIKVSKMSDQIQQLIFFTAILNKDISEKDGR